MQAVAALAGTEQTMGHRVAGVRKKTICLCSLVFIV